MALDRNEHKKFKSKAWILIFAQISIISADCIIIN